MNVLRTISYTAPGIIGQPARAGVDELVTHVGQALFLKGLAHLRVPFAQSLQR